MTPLVKGGLWGKEEGRAFRDKGQKPEFSLGKQDKCPS